MRKTWVAVLISCIILCGCFYNLARESVDIAPILIDDAALRVDSERIFEDWAVNVLKFEPKPENMPSVPIRLVFDTINTFSVYGTEIESATCGEPRSSVQFYERFMFIEQELSLYYNGPRLINSVCYWVTVVDNDPIARASLSTFTLHASRGALNGVERIREENWQ